MDYIEKLNLQTEEVKEVDLLEKHTLINNDPFSVNKYNGHTRDFLALDGDYNDGFKQLKEVDGLGISCIVSKEVKEAREDINGNIHTRLKDRLDSEVNEIKTSLDTKAYKSFITPYDFGAVKDSDSTQAFIDMINYANTNNLPMMIPKHNFIITNTLPMFSGMTMYGENGINSSDNNCNIKYIGAGYLFENTTTMINIEFRNLVFIGNSDFTNSCMKITCQRFKLVGCSIMHFQNCLVLNAIDQNVVENIIEDNLFQFCSVGIEVINDNPTSYLYSDSIIHNNFIASYKTVGIRGFMAQFKITNNQIYSGELTAIADILFGGYINYINNNNFGGKTSNLVYDNVLYSGALDENIITNNIFLNPPKNNADLYCIVINTNTIAKLLISNNIFGCERFDGNGSGKKYAIYCKGSGYQKSQIINNQGYLHKHIGGDVGSRVSDLYLVGYDEETKGYRIGSQSINEKLVIGNKLEISAYNGTPPTETNGNIGKIISDVSNGSLFISRGQYGMQRCITTTATGNVASIDMTSINKIRYTTDTTSEYPIGDIIINPNSGDIYISKGSYGNKKIMTES